MQAFDFIVKTAKDLENAVREFGIVPLFKNSVPGFSVAEHVCPEAWFQDEEGVWEWKGPVIRGTGCAYGKFFENKAAFVSPELFSDLANYRRNGYDFDARFDDGLARFDDRYLYELVSENAPVLSKDLKALGGYGRDGRKGFDACAARLQADCYILISDFYYERSKKGEPYGWGVAVYSTPEKHMGREFTKKVYRRSPEQSYQRLFGHIKGLFPQAPDRMIKRFLK